MLFFFFFSSCCERAHSHRTEWQWREAEPFNKYCTGWQMDESWCVVKPWMENARENLCMCFFFFLLLFYLLLVDKEQFIMLAVVFLAIANSTYYCRKKYSENCVIPLATPFAR